MSDLEDRQLFVIQFALDEPQQPNGQQPRGLAVPAYVADWQTAAARAAEFVAAFPSTTEAKQYPPNTKIKLNSIMVGGTILT